MAERNDGHVPVVVVDVEDDELVISMDQILRNIDGEPENEEPCTIYKVLPMIREEGSGAYDPRLISIGPFHRKNDVLKPMERIKWRFLHDLIGRSRLNNSLKKYIKTVRSLEARARSCYSEQVVPDGNAFVEMMVLDGCFIVEFLVKLYTGDHKGRLYDVNWNLPLLRNDLLLLENQIPFFVLQSLFDLCVIPELRTTLEEDSCPITLTELACVYLSPARIVDLSIPSVVHHLLHLFHSSLHPTVVSSIRSKVHPARRAINRIKHIISYSFFWLLSLILYCRRPPPGEVTSRAPRMIPSATELREAGIKFKRKEAKCFLDVTFRNGTMEFPLLSIQEATISLFRNLIAFEQCCPTAGSHFTSYTALMDNLIDTPEDVAVLERCGIVESKLGGNEVVAEFFNSLSKGGYLDYDKHYLAGLFREVKEYGAAESHRWRAMLMHDYFSNPWAIISLVAAFVLLVLTIVQTFFAIYAYFRPPS